MTNTHRQIGIAYSRARMSREIMRLLVLVGTVTTACATKKNPAAVCSDGQCADPAFPFCDVDGAVEGEVNTCIAVSCTPSQFETCDADNAIVCNADGNNYDVMHCPTGCSADSNGCKPCPANTTTCANGELDVCDANGVLHPQACAAGCIDSPAPHCAYLEPRYVPAACDTPATADVLDISNSATFDPNLDSNCTGGIVAQTGAPEICVVRYGTIIIEPGVTLSAKNTLARTGRTLAFVADQLLDVQGTLDVSAHGTLSGAGGGTSMSGDGPTAVNGGLGGGGAGGSSNGAPGGNPSTDGGADNGGAAAIDPALLSALLGGAAAYQIGDSTQLVGGGGGGGGITLIACRGDVRISGVISAGGGGGGGGFSLIGTCGGYGGGAGGNIVLQGLGISITGSVYANGGGGGGGAQADTMAGEAGADGSLSDADGAQGGFPQNGEGAGGSGGIGIASPTRGRKPTNSAARPGGGGGAAGFLQTYTPAGTSPMLTPAHVSPAFRPNGTASTR